MIAQMYYEDADAAEFIIDCIGIVEPLPKRSIENEMEYKVTAILSVGPRDTYLKNRPLTQSLNSGDYFFIEQKDLVDSPELNKIKEKYPEYSL